MTRKSIYEAMKKADALAKSRDDEFIDMMNKLSKGGNKDGRKTRYSNRRPKKGY